MKNKTRAKHKIRTIGQRERLAHRPKPYWHKIDGLAAALGFRKHAARGLQAGGAWVLRYRVDGVYHEHGFAEADNSHMPANGSTVLTFDQAVRRARSVYSERTSDEFRDEQAAADSKPYTVADCCRDYVRYLESEGRGFQDASQRLEASVIPELGDIVLDELTAKQIRAWMEALKQRRPRARSPMSGRVRRYRKVDEKDEDYPRRRAATVNRVWTSFRAALNHAFEQERLESVQFQKVKPLAVGRATVNRAHCRPIEPEEMDGFLEAVKLEGPEFENLVLVGLYSGARYGELGRLRVGDYDRKHGTLYVRPGKTGYDRVVHVIPEGRPLLERLTKDRKRDDLLLKNPDGEAWGKSHQTRPMERVITRCGLEGVSFKATRDTFGTWLLNAGVRLVVVAAELGHRNVDITRRHYAKILRTLERESTASASRIHFVGGAKIVDLEEHRAARKKDAG